MANVRCCSRRLPFRLIVFRLVLRSALLKQAGDDLVERRVLHGHVDHGPAVEDLVEGAGQFGAVHLEIEAKYDVYLKRQSADVDAFRRDEGLVLGDIDYALVPGLSNEVRAKLARARPWTVGQAGRIDGMTPAALGILAAYLRREARRKTKAIA